ncbi:MAG: hypothetical protein ACXW2I_12860 [Burkholderiales bacterium]
MVLVRLVAVLALLALAVSVILFLWTRDRRYLTWMRRVFQFALVFIVLVMILYLVERLVFIV